MTPLHVVLDCADPDALSGFWTQALGYQRAFDVDAYVILTDPGGQGPPFLLQRVPEPKQGKNRMHVDLVVPDIEAEVGRLEAIGASRTSGVMGDVVHWIVMADPEGNEFCVCDAGAV